MNGQSMMAQDVIPGVIIEVVDKGTNCNRDFLHVECVHWDEFGISFRGVEMCTGRHVSTVSIPPTQELDAWI